MAAKNNARNIYEKEENALERAIQESTAVERIGYLTKEIAGIAEQTNLWL
ncbi:MAG: hypothetical protein ACYCV0_04750 [Desulfitobacteriaceae bacterium]